MNRVDVDIYDGDIEVYSEDERVTKALIFYLRAKGISSILESIGIAVFIAGCGLTAMAILKVVQLFMEK